MRTIRFFIPFFLVGAILSLSCQPDAAKYKEQIFADERSLLEGSLSVVDTQKAAELCRKYMVFAADFPEDSNSAEFLFRAGDLAQGLGDFGLSIQCYDSILSAHPGSEKVPAALFMKAFVLEQRLGDKQSAADKYRDFINKYPSHPLTASAKASLDQISSGLTDEELVRKFEQMADSVGTEEEIRQ